jgi:uncharacterized membrane protein YoaK (UPF0700 family)
MQHLKNFALRLGLLNRATGVYLITSLSGLVDAACFIGLGHVFAEMMTGNLLMLGFSIGVHGLTSNIDRYFLVISFYVIGVVAGSRILKNKTLWKQERFGFLVEWALLCAGTILAFTLQPDASNVAGYVLLALLAFSMGILNTLIRVHGLPDMATNALTGTFTALVADSTAAAGNNHNWVRRLSSITIFLASAALGAALTTYGIQWTLTLACVVLGIALVPLLFGQDAIADK